MTPTCTLSPLAIPFAATALAAPVDAKPARKKASDDAPAAE